MLLSKITHSSTISSSFLMFMSIIPIMIIIVIVILIVILVIIIMFSLLHTTSSLLKLSQRFEAYMLNSVLLGSRFRLIRI